LQADPDDADNAPELSFGQDPRIAHFHAVTDLVVDAGRRAPVLFVLDDLQWAGRPKLQLVLHWFRSPLPLRLCLVATHRETPADINDTFDEALAEFHRLEGLTRVQVAGFDRQGVAAFVEAASGTTVDAVPARANRLRNARPARAIRRRPVGGSTSVFTTAFIHNTSSIVIRPPCSARSRGRQRASRLPDRAAGERLP